MTRARLFLLIVSLAVQAGITYGVPTNLQTLIQQSVDYNPVTLVLRSNVTLTAPLPEVPFSANITLKGACKGYKCIIDGRSKFAVFVTSTIGCTITLENVEFRNIQGGVVKGGCAVQVRNSVFRNCSNSAPGESGGVFQLDSLSGGVLIVGGYFVNNRASGDGGAISYGETLGTGGNSGIYITNSTFVGNRAGGNGGALALRASFSAPIFLKQVTFRYNKAAKDGGAVFLPLYSGNVRVLGARFDGNVAIGGSGGGLSVEAFGDPGLYTFCRNSFVGNQAPKSNKTNNLVLGVSDGGEVRFCGGVPPGALVTGASVNTKCLGCSGCFDDCKGQGSCVFDSFGQPSCKCRGNRDPDVNCASCLFGYSGVACTSCLLGFTKTPQGKCVVCRGLDRIGVDTSSSSSPASSTVASRNLCRESCRARGRGFCSFWAWFAEGSSCPRVCVTFSDGGICVKGNVTFNPTYKLYYQQYPSLECKDD